MPRRMARWARFNRERVLFGIALATVLFVIVAVALMLGDSISFARHIV